MKTSYLSEFYFTMEFFVLVFFLVTFCFVKDVTSQNQVVTYTAKESQTLQCPVADGSILLQWFVQSTNDVIFSYELSSGVVTDSRTDSKFDNFGYSATSTSFDLTIQNVDKDDGGDYLCRQVPQSTVVYELSVEVTPRSVDIDHNGNGVINVNESYTFTCIAVGVRSTHPLNLSWSTNNLIEFVDTRISENTEDSSLQDLTSTITLKPQKDDTFIRCGIEGYLNQQEINEDIITATVQLTVQYTSTLPTTTVASKTSNGLSAGTPTAVAKQTGNGISTLQTTALVSKTSNGIPALPSITLVTKTNKGTSALPPPIRASETNNDCNHFLVPTLIIICCVEGFALIVMIFSFAFLCSIRKGSRNRNTQRLATTLHATDTMNTAYMDLQETKLSSNLVNVDIPLENLTLQAPFPGKGVMKYRKAEMTLTSKRETIVVKTVSDDAPVLLAKLQADEARKLATLTSNANVAQFLGRCNNVPNLLCYEFVNGTKLGEHLRENFQPSKIHQYGNTKQKRYHVPEKGSVESLPRVALQIARGMEYLIAQKFLHPGLRSEKVIIDGSGQCKLYDFVSADNAKDIMAIQWSKSVPYQWMPPEYLFLEKLGPSVDVWSFGVLIWEIFSCGAIPHEGKGRNDVEKKLREKENLPLPNNCPGAIWQITLNCWDKSPDKRPLFDQLSLQLCYMCSDNKEYHEI